MHGYIVNIKISKVRCQKGGFSIPMLVNLCLGKPVKYFSSGQTVVNSGWVHPSRTIDTFVLLIGLEGEVYIKQEEEEYKLSEGDAIMLVPGIFHEGYKPCPKNSAYFWCHFKCENWEILSEYEDIETLFNIHADTNFWFPTYFKCHNIDKIILLFKSIINYGRDVYISSIINDYLLSALLIELNKQAHEYIYQLTKHVNEGKIKYLFEFIRANSNKTLTLSEYSKYLCYNPFYLSKLFKKNFGISFKQYIIQTRLQKAKKMLLTTPLSIKEIAYACGFKDEKYFMKVFKKYESLTPSEYRNAFSSIHINTN